MNWAQITITTSQDASEAIANFLFEMDALGVEFKDNTDATTSLIVYYPLDDRVNTRVKRISEFLSKLPTWGIQARPGKIDLKQIESEEWTDAWKAAFPPQQIGEHLLIAPTWHEISPDGTTILIRLDPGMAFGTGYHPTTRLSLKMLEQTVKPNQQVVDIGTGSGILAIAAVKLGANRVDAIELDPTALPVAENNFTINGVTDNISLYQADGIKSLNDTYDLIVGNILTKAILPIIPDCPSRLKPEGTIIFSGILETELKVVEAVLIENRLACDQVTRQEEDGVIWVALKAKLVNS